MKGQLWPAAPTDHRPQPQGEGKREEHPHSPRCRLVVLSNISMASSTCNRASLDGPTGHQGTLPDSDWGPTP